MPRKYARNADPTRQDVWISISNLIPNQRGNYMTPNVGGQVTGAGPATPGTTLRAWCSILPSGTAVAHVGTTTKLYSSADLSTFTDRSSGAYTSSATDWNFCQFGNYTIATNNVDAIQVRDASGVGNFAALGGTPPTTAKILVTQSGAVLAFNTNTGGQYWAASDVGNHANWTTGEATSGPINHRPGPITAAVAFQDVVIVFKASSVYRMRYVGGVVKWTVELLADGIGASGPHAAIVCGDVVTFVGPSGGYLFDGATFRPADVEDSGDMSDNTTLGASVYWPATQSVWFWFRNQSGVIVWNHASQRWGSFSLYKTGSDTALTTYVLLTGPPSAIRAFGITEGNAYIIDLALNPCVLTLNQRWGQQGAVAAQVVTGMVGRLSRLDTLFAGIAPRFVTHSFSSSSGQEVTGTDASLAIVTYKAPTLGASPATPSVSPVTSSSDQARFDFMLTCKFATFTISSTVAPFEIDDIMIETKDAGRT